MKELRTINSKTDMNNKPKFYCFSKFRIYRRLRLYYKNAIKQRLMKKDFLEDFRLYRDWNYNNPEVNTQSSKETRISRQTHIIEKGLSLSNPRKGFGLEKINDLFLMLDDYIESGFLTDSIPFQNAICVICKYIEFQKIPLIMLMMN